MGVGTINEFDVKTGNWTGYCERLQMYFLANGVDEDVQLPTLIAVMGEEAYLLLSTLSSPIQPADLTYEQAVLLLKNHLQPKPSILAQRYLFRQRRQADGETVSDYVAELKKLAKTCDFGASLEENLRDQLVCGIISESTRQRLFAEDDSISYNTAVKLASTLETAEKNACAIERGIMAAASTSNMHKVDIGHKCMACGEIGHKTENCKYKNFECSACKRLGHLRRMCPEKNARLESNQTAGSQSRGGSVTFNGSGGRGGRRAVRNGGGGGGGAAARGGRERTRRGGGRSERSHWVQPSSKESQSSSSGNAPAPSDDDEYEDEESDDYDDEPIYQMSLTKYKPT